MPRVRPSGTESQIIISDDVRGPSLAGGVPLRALRAPSAGRHPVLPAWRESPWTLGTASRAFSGLRIRSRRPVWHGPLLQEARQASEEEGSPACRRSGEACHRAGPRPSPVLTGSPARGRATAGRRDHPHPAGSSACASRFNAAPASLHLIRASSFPAVFCR